MTKPGLIDSHLHLQDYEAGTDIPRIIEESAESGVTHFVCNGTEEADWQTVLGYATDDARVIPCFGVHPWFVDRLSSDWVAGLERFLETRPSGVGEIGLDRNVERCDKQLQETVFRTQLELARKYQKPAMIHCVKSWGWMMDVLRSESDLPCGMLFHSYGGPADLIKLLANRGAYFSYSGKVLFTNYLKARDSIRAIPRDRLLVETDAPCMLPPEEFRARTVWWSDGDLVNHPANLPLILAGIAEMLGEPVERLRERVWGNSLRFFAPILGV